MTDTVVEVPSLNQHQIVTLVAARPEETPEEALLAWASKNDVAPERARLIRAIGSEFIFEVLPAKHGEPKAATAPAASTGIDFGRDALLTPFGKATLFDRYLLPEESSPQEAFMRAARAFADNEAHAQRLYNYVSRLWFMFATPVLSNAPVRLSWGTDHVDNMKAHHFDAKVRGMPISCFLSYVPDSRKGLTAHYTETAFLSSVGGGVGSYWGAVRSNGIDTSGGSRSSGVIPFMKVVDSEVMAFAQGVTRRASYAAYMDISHPEIVEFLEMRKPTGGDINRKCLNLHNGVCIPDSFMEIIENCMRDPDADDAWPLIDPHTKRIVQVVSAKDLWQRLLELRIQTGEPYILFIDTANRALPKAQREAGLRVQQSNLCSEITLPTNEQRTAVCCLSSTNLEYYDEWSKNEQFIEDLIRMLDNVLEYFIQNAGRMKETEREVFRAMLSQTLSAAALTEEQFERVAAAMETEFANTLNKAVYSASMERSVGLGAMGFHSYLQKKNISFEGALATSANRRVFAFIKRKAEAATVKLAQERGACPDARGEMRRNMHLLAIAPNASSSIICGGTSASVEPVRANAFTHKTQSGSWLVKNPYLEDILEFMGMNTDEVWTSIIVNKGSVQHLKFLTKDQRDVFKTAMELDQRWIIEHASQRQEYICQAQSINTFLPADVEIAYLHHVHFRAWKAGLKSLYYLRSESIKRADIVSQKFDLAELRDTENTCLSCEG